MADCGCLGTEKCNSPDCGKSSSLLWGLKVLDKGYVKLVNTMGTDLDVVNAARVSFKKESKYIEKCKEHNKEMNWWCSDCGDSRYYYKTETIKTLSESDQKLIKFLIKNEHMSPFRHCFMTFEVKAPLMVCRQWWKYVVGSDHTMDGWNEVSRRYVAEEPEFYIPDVWRSAPETKKQGSGESLGTSRSNLKAMELRDIIKLGVRYYKTALLGGVCAEQARLYLPAYAMYTTWRWSASLQSVLHFLSQRLEEDAQWEIQQYAKAVHQFAIDKFPYSVGAFNEKTTV